MGVRYIDNVPCIDAGGEIRKLAALPPTPQQLGQALRYTAKYGIDRDSWADFDFETLLKLIIRNQRNYGSCTGHAGVTAEDIILRKIAGDDGEIPLLSCTFPYAHVNGGRDQGASVSSILQVLKQLGTCTHAECGTDQIYKNQIPQSAYQTALKYQVFEAFLCKTYDEIIDAINRGFPVPFGIEVGNNFSRLDNNGIAPLPDMVIGGHALCGIGIKLYRGDWIIKTQNSWGTQWGVNGCCYLTRRHFDYRIDAYAIMYGDNLDPPPVVPKLEEKKTFSLSTDLSEQVMKEMMLAEDKKFLEAVNAPLPPAPESDPEPAPVPEEVMPPVVEPEQINQENSLLAQFQEPEQDVGTPSMTHTDPEGVLEATGKKKRHKHQR